MTYSLLVDRTRRAARLRQHVATTAYCLLVFAITGSALTALEHQQARADRVNQEQIAWAGR
jgi:hypothetical protein